MAYFVKVRFLIPVGDTYKEFHHHSVDMDDVRTAFFYMLGIRDILDFLEETSVIPGYFLTLCNYAEEDKYHV